MKLSRVVPICIAVTLSSSAVALAEGSDTPVIGSGIICNTSDQIARLANLMDTSDPREAMLVVNREASDPTACGAAVVAFQPGKKVGDIHSKDGTLEIREITIIAAAAKDGWHKVDPQTQFTMLRPEGLEI